MGIFKDLIVSGIGRFANKVYAPEFVGNLTGKATSATYSSTATYSTNSGSSSKATSATSATYATTATSAGSASKATSATSATYASTSTKAGTATYATNSGTATYSTSAGSASKATSATSATYATTATSAGTATYASSAGSASTATVDSGGLNINQSYIKDLSVSGKKITYTKGNGTTGSFNTQDTTYSNLSLGQGYGTCSTAAATTAKVVSMASYSLVAGGIVSVLFTYAVPANATLNINSKGAKPIHYKGAAITAGIIEAGDIATFMCTGSYYYLLAIDNIQSLKKSVAEGKQSLVDAFSDFGISTTSDYTFYQFGAALDQVYDTGYDDGSKNSTNILNYEINITYEGSSDTFTDGNYICPFNLHSEVAANDPMWLDNYIVTLKFTSFAGDTLALFLDSSSSTVLTGTLNCSDGLIRLCAYIDDSLISSGVCVDIEGTTGNDIILEASVITWDGNRSADKNVTVSM